MTIAKAAELLAFLELIEHSPLLREDARSDVLREIDRTTPWTALEGSLPATFGAIHTALKDAIEKADRAPEGNRGTPPDMGRATGGAKGPEVPQADPKGKHEPGPAKEPPVAKAPGAPPPKPGKNGGRR